MSDLVLSAPQIPLQTLSTGWLQQAGVRLDVLRCDLLDPLLSGNKFFKLKYNLQAAKASGTDTMLSFGGPWSNHLHALAAAGQRYGMNTIGVVRGEATAQLNPCLQEMRRMGMHLHFVSRSDYRRKDTPEFFAELNLLFGDCYLIPEGGANLAGILGCQELAQAIPPDTYTALLLACGTGTTLTGLVTAMTTPVIGIQVLKGSGYLQKQVTAMLAKFKLQSRAEWQMLDTYHCGAYARSNFRLQHFMQSLTATTDLPLEPVYSGKLFLAVHDLVTRNAFPAGSRLLAIHGGGLQGARGFGNVSV